MQLDHVAIRVAHEDRLRVGAEAHGPPLSGMPAASRRVLAAVMSGQSSATCVMPGCFSARSIRTFGALALGAFRMRFNSRPDGWLRTATGSGPSGPAVF